MARLVPHDQTGPIEVKPQKESVWICQCGLSQTLPFCDGSHNACKKEAAGKVYIYGSDRKSVVDVRDQA